MKIVFKPEVKLNQRLIIVAKNEKPSAAFLKQWSISPALLELANSLGSTTFTSGNDQNFILTIDKKAGPKKVLSQLSSWTSKNLPALQKNIGLSLDKNLDSQLEPILLGILNGRYQIDLFKSARKSNHPFLNAAARIEIQGKINATRKLQIDSALHLYSAQKMAMDMVNAPGNKLKPSDMVRFARNSAKAQKYAIKVLGKKQIQETGLHSLLAVNRGSEWDPAFIIAEYKGKTKAGKKLPKIGLVGKGVTFDTGGISMKASNHMHYMKSDMGGAAAVLGTIDAAARLKLPIHLIAIVPATDNCVDARAIKPGDVIDSYSGKTIEVIDTDAEGRLILADGLWYMQKKFNPEVIIDLATLTGSAVGTFGYESSALFSRNDKLAKALIEAGEETGERCWQLPLWDEYSEDLKSDIADIKNYNGKPLAGAISAAKFLEEFTNEHPAWAHLDIAGVAFGSTPTGKDKAGTGYGIRLLVSYLQKNFA